MSKEQFEKSWIRESGEQPGIMLDVISVSHKLFSRETAS